jgi:hypothetical protein
MTILPSQFSHLEGLAPWSLATETQRNIKRHASSMDEINSFADTLLPHLDEIFTYLDEFSLDAMPEDALRLFYLTLSLAEVAPAIEAYDQPSVIDGMDARRMPAVEDFILQPRP